MGEPKDEVCSIRIMFPVQSDTEAIEYKRKIREALGDLEGVRMNFDLSSGFGRSGVPT